MVSVVIPTYNRAQYIGETIQSVLDQTYPNVEIIVIDDESTDNTSEVVARFGTRVTYVWQKNSERAVARNQGWKRARSEFVAFLDSDDCWEPEALREMLRTLRADPALALVAAGCRIMGKDGCEAQTFSPAGGAEGILPGAFYQLLRSNVIGSPSAVLLRRRALERLGGFDEDRRLIAVEDWELWTRLAFQAPLACLPRPLVRYRRHEGNSPLAGMRLRYPCLVDALLNKLPLTEREREEVCKLSALRLVDYAGDFFELKQAEGVRHCLGEATRLHPAVASSSDFDRLVRWSGGDMALTAGFTTTISSKEGLTGSEEVRRTLRKLGVQDKVPTSL
jgi:GT2 family glycosyltransferase